MIVAAGPGASVLGYSAGIKSPTEKKPLSIGNADSRLLRLETAQAHSRKHMPNESQCQTSNPPSPHCLSPKPQQPLCPEPEKQEALNLIPKPACVQNPPWLAGTNFGPEAGEGRVQGLGFRDQSQVGQSVEEHRHSDEQSAWHPFSRGTVPRFLGHRLDGLCIRARNSAIDQLSAFSVTSWLRAPRQMGGSWLPTSACCVHSRSGSGAEIQTACGRGSSSLSLSKPQKLESSRNPRTSMQQN